MILVFLAIVVVMTFGAVAYYCAIFAMPMWVAMSVFQHVHQSAGVIPSVISAIVAGILSVGLVLMTMGLARNPALRLAALAAFVTPAAMRSRMAFSNTLKPASLCICSAPPVVCSSLSVRFASSMKSPISRVRNEQVCGRIRLRGTGSYLAGCAGSTAPRAGRWRQRAPIVPLSVCVSCEVAPLRLGECLIRPKSV